MKLRHSRILPLLALCVVGRASSADLYWNASGDGVWSTGPADKNWNTVSGAPSGNVTWSDPSADRAIFDSGIPSNLIVWDTVATSGITLNAGDLSILAGTITLVPDASANNPFIATDSGTLTISSTLTGTDGLIKKGISTLVLEGAHNYSGTTQVTAGTLDLTGSLSSAVLQIASGATVIDRNSGLPTSTWITNDGTLTVSVPETVARYIQNGNGVLDGAATLTTTEATLNGGTVAGHLYGSITTKGIPTGSVLVSGTIGGNLLRVTGRMLTLTGTSENQRVDIDSLGILMDVNGGLNAAAVVTNQGGTLSLATNDSVSTYTQSGNGRLTGFGVLTATDGAFLSGGSIDGNLLGDTTVTRSTSVSGSIGGGTLDVTGGTLSLTGTSSNTFVTISSNATLHDSAGGLSRDATLTNNGTLTLVKADTISHYVQNVNGLLDGPATLTATTATLNGGTVAGSLIGNITSTGDVLVSGTIDGNELDITSGTFNLTGVSFNKHVTIAANATLLDSSGDLRIIGGTLTNYGTLTVNALEGVGATYTQYPGSLLDGSSPMSVRYGSTLHGGTIAGSIWGDITSTGDVLVSGSIGDGSLDITGGTLNLTGTSTNTPVSIASGAKLIDTNGGLADGAAVINTGTLHMLALDTVASYVSYGGVLSGESRSTGGAAPSRGSRSVVSEWSYSDPIAAVKWIATLPSDSRTWISNFSPDPELSRIAALRLTTPLFATTATLNDGSEVAGGLSATTLTTHGAVSISGSAFGDNTLIADGTLTNTGSFGASQTLTLTSGATLVAGGIQTYQTLSTAGAGPATWQGDLSNPTTISPGGTGGFGTLAVTGNFTNQTSGTNRFDLGGGMKDLITVGGTGTFGGSLVLNQTGAVTPFVPIQIVAANDYSGNYNSLTENLDAIVWFNPANGTITPIALPTFSGDGTLYGASPNQTSVWIALYDDVIDPGVENVSASPYGGHSIISGIASSANRPLLNALTASITPGGLNAAVLTRLSPEVYASLGDYAVHATRSHQRAALAAPSLGLVRAPVCPHANGSKNALTPLSTGVPVEWFAALDTFGLGADSSLDGADYDMTGFGFIGGLRGSPAANTSLAAYLAADSGEIEGALIDADATGWSLGFYAKTLLEERTHTLLTAGMSYGSFEFDGTRDGLAADNGGWSPAEITFGNVSADALEFHLALSSIIWRNDRFLLMPSIGLRYVSGSMDGFVEAAGDPLSVPLAVDGDHYQSVLAELAMRGEMKVTSNLTAHALAGFTAGIGDNENAITSHFANGTRPMRALAPGIDDDAFFIGAGFDWRTLDRLSIGLDWRSDFRDGAESENRISVSATVRF